MFDKIFEYFLLRGKISPKIKKELEKLSSFYEFQREVVMEQLISLRNKYSYEKLKKVKKYSKTDVCLTFYRGLGSYSVTPEIQYLVDGMAEFDSDDDVQSICDNIEVPWYGIEEKDSNIPASIKPYYADKACEIQEAIFHSWFASIWQEINGFECGLRVQIIENNSVKSFSLNDFAWDGFSDFYSSKNKFEKEENPFNRNLTIEEIFIRAYLFDSPYKSFWRYFEKEGHFREIALYANDTAFRIGKVDDERSYPIHGLREHESTFEARKFVIKISNQWANENWIEQLRPLNLDFPEKLYPDAIEINASGWYEYELSRGLREKEIKRLEGEFEIKFPSTYRNFLKLLNGSPYNSSNRNFPINNFETIRVADFFSVAEIRGALKTREKLNQILEKHKAEIVAKSISSKIDTIRIANVKGNKFLHIDVEPDSSEFGHLYLEDDSDVLKEIEYDFEKFIKYSH